MTLSVVITTYHRPESLQRTLESLGGIADEIVIVDSGSQRQTAALGRKHKATVYARPNNPMLNVNKNYGFSKAHGEWILSLDDDEVLTPALVSEIRDLLAGPHEADADGYWIPRKNIIFGRWIRYGIWWPDRQLRLFRSSKGRFPEQHVHEYISVPGKTGTLTAAMQHFNYDSVAQYLEKMETLYIPSEVGKMSQSGYVVSWRDAVRFPVSDFLKVYFAQKGYKDGLHGLVLALLQAFYAFLVFAKLWEKASFPDIQVPFDSVRGELTGVKRDTAYWMESAAMSESGSALGKLYHRILRKLALL